MDQIISELKLENDKTFILCKGVFIDTPVEKENFDIETYSIDELS